MLPGLSGLVQDGRCEAITFSSWATKLCAGRPGVDSCQGDSGHYLHTIYTLSTHYLHNIYTIHGSTDHIPATGDTSGVVVEYQDQATEYSAGILSLHVHGTVPASHTQQDQVRKNIWSQSQKYLVYRGNI